MFYFVSWLADDRVIAEKKCDDLLKAERYIFECLETFKQRGATAAKVWNGQATFFKIEWKSA